MTTSLTRRNFIRVSAAAGGLLLGVTLPADAWRRFRGQQQARIDPTLFARIAPDNTVTITVAKSEMGQGVRTSLAMLVAEELDADWDLVRVEQAPFDARYGNQGTGGSGSVMEGWTQLRQAGAQVRAMLVSAAAQEWGVPEAECTTEASFVVHGKSGRRASYGSVAERAARLPVPEQVALKPKTQFRILGKPRSGIDVPDITHGRAIFGIDVKVPGMLYASIERAAAFGATVKSFDAAAARQVPGVRDVVQLPAVANGVVTHAGVAVVAGNTWAAMQGRKALKVEWEPGPHANESTPSYHEFMSQAMDRPGAETVYRVGDAEGVLARAGKVYSAGFEAPFLSHATMEPMNCTASVKGNQAEIWSPTQFPDWATGATARVLKLDPKNVRLHVTLMGGGFGRRINPDFTVEAALLSQKLQQPVKVVWTRDDDLRHDFYRPCAMHRLEAALGPDGFPVAWRHRMSTPAISATYGPPPDGGYGKGVAAGVGPELPYRVPNQLCEYTLLQSGVPRGWWRAVESTHTIFALESFIDELAEAAGKDPVEYRLALIAQVPPGQSEEDRKYPFDPERMKGVLRLAAGKAGWGKPLPQGHGMGVAVARDHLIYCAEAVEASVENGKLRIHKVVCAVDTGPIINPDGARAQLEGGVVQALSAALKERITIAGGAVEQRNFDSYRVLRINEAPLVIETHFIETDTEPTGMGEAAMATLAPAVANAITRATGKRPRVLPLEVAAT